MTNSSQRWNFLTTNFIISTFKFELITELYENNYKNEDKNNLMIKPTWFPSDEIIEKSNIKYMMTKLNLNCYNNFYKYSIHQPERFWDACINSVGIQFDHPYSHVFTYINSRDNNNDSKSNGDKCRERIGMLCIIIISSSSSLF
jgi:hypothetical protein